MITTRLTEAQAEFAPALIIKTAYRSSDRDRFRAYAEVAADVLHIAMTPAHFTGAITDALTHRPPPATGGTAMAPAKAEVLRAAWRTGFVADVYARLGITD